MIATLQGQSILPFARKKDDGTVATTVEEIDRRNQPRHRLLPPLGIIVDGTSATRFTGTFEGNGFTISNLYINRDDRRLHRLVWSNKQCG